MKLKNYFLSKFVQTLRVEESFFYKVKFDKKVKLTDELIALNYKKHAPFKNPSLSTLMEEKNLYIWFYEKALDAKLIIPEAYLLFDFFKDKYPNALLLIENNGSFMVLIIKNSILENSYALEEEDETLIAMEMNKYALSTFKKVEQKEYLKIKEKLLERLKIQDIYKWNSLKVEPSNLVPTFVNFVAYPFAFLLFFIMAVESYHLKEVKEKLATVETRYSEIKSKNDDVREKINNQNKKEQKWLTFAERELPYADPIKSFVTISKAFANKEISFQSFSIVGSKVKLSVQTKEDFIEGVNILNKIEGLENVALKYSNKKRERASYEATLQKGAF